MWKKADVAVKDEFTRRKQVSKIILVLQNDFILESFLSVEILFKWCLCAQLDYERGSVSPGVLIVQR